MKTMFLHFNTTIASSAPVERLFSKSALIVSPKKGITYPMTFLNSCSHSKLTRTTNGRLLHPRISSFFNNYMQLTPTIAKPSLNSHVVCAIYCFVRKGKFFCWLESARNMACSLLTYLVSCIMRCH